MESGFNKIAVIGSNSFSGSHFVNHVLQKGIEVLGISRSPEYDHRFLPYLYNKSKPKNFTFHQIDINREMEKACAICDEFRPDAIVNYAAQGEVRNSWRWPEQWYQTNCLGVVRFTDYFKEKDYLKRYIAISTPEVYGTTGLNVAENHNYNPSTPYAASKLAGDLHLFLLFKRYNFPVVFTRAANLYGIHQQLFRIIPVTYIKFRSGQKLDLHGRGENLRAFIHARDVAELTFRAITKGRNGEVYHFAPDNGLLAMTEVVRMICDLAGFDFETSVNLVDENFGQDRQFSLDASKAKKELGWSQSITLEDGVIETIKWLEANWAYLKTQPHEYIHQI